MRANGCEVGLAKDKIFEIVRKKTVTADIMIVSGVLICSILTSSDTILNQLSLIINIAELSTPVYLR